VTAAQFEDAEGRALVEAIHQRKRADCACVCHKLGYVYCGPGWCPNHTEPKEGQ
jgi:hypothetical protein